MWSRIRSKVVTTDPISTTNITGFFISVRGFSFRNESRTAPLMIPPVQSDLLFRSLLTAMKLCSGPSVWEAFPGVVAFRSSVDCVVMVASENLSGVHQQVLENRAE